MNKKDDSVETFRVHIPSEMASEVGSMAFEISVAMHMVVRNHAASLAQVAYILGLAGKMFLSEIEDRDKTAFSNDEIQLFMRAIQDGFDKRVEVRIQNVDEMIREDEMNYKKENNVTLH